MTTQQFNELVDMYSDGLYRFAMKNLRDDDDAQDVVQNTFEAIWKNRDNINPEKLKSYAFTTCYHQIIDHVRRSQKQDKLEAKHERVAVNHKSFTGAKEIIDQALRQLPEVQRSVVMLRDYEGYHYDEIGEITGLSESQVKVYIFRARQTLKTLIGNIENVL